MYVISGWGRCRKDSFSICLASCQLSGLQGTYIAPKSTHQTECPPLPFLRHCLRLQLMPRLMTIFWGPALLWVVVEKCSLTLAVDILSVLSAWRNIESSALYGVDRQCCQSRELLFGVSLQSRPTLAAPSTKKEYSVYLLPGALLRWIYSSLFTGHF